MPQLNRCIKILGIEIYLRVNLISRKLKILLNLKGKLNAQPVKIETRAELRDEKCIVSGWGKMDSDSFFTPSILRSTQVEFSYSDINTSQIA